MRRRRRHPDRLLRRCVAGRPVNAFTTALLAFAAECLAAQEVTALLLGWEKASRHLSHTVRSWRQTATQTVKRSGQAVRIVLWRLAVNSPGLNPIERKRVHGTRAISELDQLVSATPHWQHVSPPIISVSQKCLCTCPKKLLDDALCQSGIDLEELLEGFPFCYSQALKV